MFIHDETAGAIALGFANDVPCDEEDLKQARQLTNQVAVALSNAHLVEDLDALNWGALTALARTVDAKSPWTAGHSERVTQLGIKIGERMGLAKEEIDILHRGGLLHDIGKIGVPAAILDKPDRLTDEEYEIMKKHPEIGANILQPIAAYSDVIPIVRQHHERWNGSGYPDGLAGRQIHPYARIFAVADVYDAIISDRPYRAGFTPEEVVRHIVAGDGTDFDPEVVAAFLEVMTDEGLGLLSPESSAGAVG
jgi:putative nucleotidyltransferase with HDIG domain